MSTIKDVSRATGLSISTISKYINGGTVRSENKTLIDGAIKTLGFKVNQAARSLKTNRTMTVGVLLPSLDVSFFASIVTEMDARLERAGYNTIVCSYNHDPESEMRKLEFLIEQQVDGIVFVAEHVSRERLERIAGVADRTTPVVLLDRLIQDMAWDYVGVDNRLACKMATEQFLMNGHRRIGLIMGPPTISTACERRDGYLDALESAGISACDGLIRTGDYAVNEGYRIFGELMDMDNPPTAVLSINYDMTLGAITAAFERKLRIPKDVSFIGYDDLQLTQISNPPITIVLQPTEQMAAEAAQAILKRMRGDWSGWPKKSQLKACLMLHDSIAHIEGMRGASE